MLTAEDSHSLFEFVICSCILWNSLHANGGCRIGLIVIGRFPSKPVTSLEANPSSKSSSFVSIDPASHPPEQTNATPGGWCGLRAQAPFAAATEIENQPRHLPSSGIRPIRSPASVGRSPQAAPPAAPCPQRTQGLQKNQTPGNPAFGISRGLPASSMAT